MSIEPLRLPLLSLVLLSLIIACGSPPTATVPTTLSSLTVNAAQSQGAWTQARANLPSTIALFRPAFVPKRFGAPQLLEARVDKTYGPLYTIVYSAPEENLAFILNMGKGALGNFPPAEQREAITLLGSRGELQSSAETHTMGVFWQTAGGSYQIKAYSSQMTKDELTKISESVAQQ